MDPPCAQIHWRLRPRPERADEIRQAVRRIIRCAVRRWDVPGGAAEAIRIWTCESGLWPWAYGYGNAGVTQQRLRYWAGRADHYLRRDWGFGPNPSPYNARANVIVGSRMAHESGWGAWSCA